MQQQPVFFAVSACLVCTPRLSLKSVTCYPPAVEMLEWPEKQPVPHERVGEHGPAGLFQFKRCVCRLSNFTRPRDLATVKSRI